MIDENSLQNIYYITAIGGVLWAVGTFIRSKASTALRSTIDSRLIGIHQSLEKVNGDNEWIMRQLRPKNGETLCEIVEGSVTMIADHGKKLVAHTKQLNAQDEALRRIEDRTGDVAGKVVAIHQAEGQRLTKIQETVNAAKDEAANTAKVVKETLSKHEGK